MSNEEDKRQAEIRRQNQEQDAAERAANYAKDHRDGGRDR